MQLAKCFRSISQICLRGSAKLCKRLAEKVFLMVKHTWQTALLAALWRVVSPFQYAKNWQSTGYEPPLS